MSKKDEKRKGILGGMIGAGVTALLNVLIFHPAGVPGFLLCALGACAAGAVVGIMSSGLDTTTHNRQDRASSARQAEEEIKLTGDPVADEVLTNGQDLLRKLREDNKALDDTVIAGQLDELNTRCRSVLHVVSDNPGKAPQARKLLNYYLPTAGKMLDNYRTMASRGVSSDELNKTRSRLISGMNMVLTACQSLTDKMHQENVLDVSTDVDVLEQMLMRDGFLDNVQSPSIQVAPGSATAAEAQMRVSEVPILTVREEPAVPTTAKKQEMTIQ